MPGLSLSPSTPKLRGRFHWADAVVLAGTAALAFGLVDVFGRWLSVFRSSVEIDLSPWALPRYAVYSLSRAGLSYVLCIAFALVTGYASAHSPKVERILIPLLDVGQSLPILAFMPSLVLGLIALFPRSRVGLELTSVFMLFTCQAWNLCFGFYYAIRSIPRELHEAATVYRLGPWRRFTRLELPAAVLPLVWNSVLSIAGGWFFLEVCESFVLGDQSFRLPGLGAYLVVAHECENWPAVVYAILAMAGIVLVLDLLFWRPLVAWGQRFKVEESPNEEESTSRVLDWFRDSRYAAPALGAVARVTEQAVDWVLGRVGVGPVAGGGPAPAFGGLARRAWRALLWGGVLVCAGAVVYGAALVVVHLAHVTLAQWGRVFLYSLFTLGRVTAAVLLATVWTVPVGVAIGSSPRVARVLQPVVQFMTSFPASMLFPLASALVLEAGGNIDVLSVCLMLLGGQWYILFNIVSGAMAIPGDLRTAADVYHLRGWRRWRLLILPGIFPSLVTGWVTAVGGSWNASIITEYFKYKDTVHTAHGLGALITQSSMAADFPMLAASSLTMALVVVTMNRLVWLKLSTFAETRYSLAG